MSILMPEGSLSFRESPSQQIDLFGCHSCNHINTIVVKIVTLCEDGFSVIDEANEVVFERKCRPDVFRAPSFTISNCNDYPPETVLLRIVAKSHFRSKCYFSPKFAADKRL